jgi:hypothetical protein
MPDTLVDNLLPGQDCYGSGRRLRVGVLSNPRSGGNRKGGKGVRKILAQRPGVMQREASTPAEVTESLADFARNGIELVVVNGGDGTVQAALTAIGNEGMFSRPPLLALLCAGTTSMLPRDVGFPCSPAAALPRILAWAESTDASLVVRQRPVLRVQRASGQAPLFGMFFGAGAICQGIRLFHGRDNVRGWRGQLMPAFTMFRLFLSVLFGRSGTIAPLQASTSLDKLPAEQRTTLLILISTLERLFFGLRPYWGKPGGPLHYTAVGSAPKRLLSVLASLTCHRKCRQALPENGFFSHNVHEVQLDMRGDFTLDGELYEAGEGPVTIMSAGPVAFLCSR